MQSDIGFCSQCGAQGAVGAKCEYCGSTIVAPHNIQDESHSMSQSWSDFHLDGFLLVPENIEGESDCPDFYVIEGKKTGNQGLINRYGEIVVPCIYDYLKIYLDYELCCAYKDYRHGVIGVDGHIVIPFDEENPLGIYVISDNCIVGYNRIFDLHGNLKIELPSDDRIVSLTESYATTYPDNKGLFSVESGELLLPQEYRIDKVINYSLFLVNKVTDGFTRYGLFNPQTKEFVLPVEYLSIQYQESGSYVAKLKSVLDNRITTMSTLTFKTIDGDIVIEKEEKQNFQTANSPGCLLLLLPLLSPLLYFFL